MGLQIGPMHRAEEISLERFALGWPWVDARNAAALACELIRWATPVPVWVAADDPRIEKLNYWIGAEDPLTVLLDDQATADDGPYCIAGDQRVNIDPPEVTEARFEIASILAYVTNYVRDEPVLVPNSFGEPDDPPLKKLYWYATEIGKRAASYGARAGETLARLYKTKHDLGSPWYHAGRAAQEACEFLRKHATSSQTVGAIDGAGGAVLHRISLHLVFAGKPSDEVTGRMFHWRVHDGLKGRQLSPELDANLRPAFEAAWRAGEYEFAYSLLNDLEQLVEI